MIRLLRKAISEPLLHFLLIGAGLFILFGIKGGPTTLPGNRPDLRSATITVSQSDMDQLTKVFSKTWQRSPTNEELKYLVEDYVRNEIYYREALATGLLGEDSVVRRRMRMKMEYIFEDIASQTEPTDEELLAYMLNHSDSYRIDPQISFRHVFVDCDQGRHNAEEEAGRLLARLQEGADPVSVGDPFLLGSKMDLIPAGEIRRLLGDAFGSELMALPLSQWQGPVKSTYGLHLVFVSLRTKSTLPDLSLVRDLVRQELMAERQKQLKDDAYAKLKKHYTIVIDNPDLVTWNKKIERDMQTEVQ